MGDDLKGAIQRLTGHRPRRLAPLGGGCVGQVYRIDFDGQEPLVAKVGGADSGLGIEGRMLTYLREHSRLPVPGVVHADDTLLLMTWLETGGGISDHAQIHAADLLADLHGIAADRFGFEFDTLIGGLHQPNPWTPDWVAFFRGQRLLYMGRQALDAGRLPGAVFARLEKLAGRLENWLDGSVTPALIHGDMWSGNVLCRDGRIAGFVDPALYFADAEIELAFATLFGTFGDSFFGRYQELRPLRPGFFEERRALYNLYPLLVHVRLFGGSYVNSVDGALKKFGC